MKEQTAMQELIDKLESIIESRYTYGISSSDYKSMLEYAQQLLEKEQEQLYESYLDGMRDESENN